MAVTQSATPPTDVAFGETDLTLCDREPIHTPGSIQPYGVLLVVDRRDFMIRQFAGDTRFLLGVNPARMPQLSLYSLFNEQVLMPVAERLRVPSATVMPSIQAGIVSRTGALPLDLTLHAEGELAIIEIEPSRRASMGGRDPIVDVKQMLADVASADNLLSCCEAAARTVRSITGFDRVMVYQFLPDGSGKVIAEVKSHDLDPYLGLHYPASDIPKQARELYRRNWLRLIPDVDYTPALLQPNGGRNGTRMLDMSMCFLRSVSPVHLEYLRNMGVTASMSISIVHGDTLWGLIACHNYTPRYIGADLRIACELFAQVFSLQLSTTIEAERVRRRFGAQRVHEALTADLLRVEDVGSALVEGSVTLLDLLPASGAVVWLNGRLGSVGQVPPDDFIVELIAWLDARHDTVFHTNELGNEFPPALRHPGCASGLLAIASERLARDYILWFRPEVIETVTWGGEPKHIPSLAEAGHRLSPRKSFTAWREEVRNRSEPWTSGDIDIARAFRVTLLETILRQVDAARHEREAVIKQQNLLMGELDHRVKNVLATMSAVVQLTKSNVTDIEAYAQSLQYRIRSMAMAHELLTEARWERLSLASLLKEELAPYVGESRATLSGETVMLSPRAALSLALVVHELTTNAVKYGALSNNAGRIAITWERDAGGGVKLEWAEADGPKVIVPEQSGFGSRLIERSLQLELGGEADIAFNPDGIICRMILPSEHVFFAA